MMPWPTAPSVWTQRRRAWLWRLRCIRPSATRPSRTAASSAWRWTALGAGRTYKAPCALCDPIKDPKGEVHGSLHHFVLISVVGVGVTLPIDVEPYGPGDSEYAAAQRLLRRTVDHLGARFADYVVGDGEYATAPFLHTSGNVGLPVVARLKQN